MLQITYQQPKLLTGLIFCLSTERWAKVTRQFRESVVADLEKQGKVVWDTDYCAVNRCDHKSCDKCKEELDKRILNERFGPLKIILEEI